MKWYLPSFSGDFRLESDPDHAQRSLLTMISPTPGELLLLGQAGAKLFQRGLVDAEDLWDVDPGASATQSIAIRASVNDVAPLFVKTLKAGQATLTAIKFTNGKMSTIAGDNIGEAVATLTAKAAPEAEAPQGKPKPAAAVTVKRPTPCCPECQPGPIEPALEVLREFSSEEQRQQWEDHRYLVAVGNLSGHRYLLTHRHSRRAAVLGKICCDLDDRVVLKFHDTLVPPEEEVLAAKLILEHREDWLRNEATHFGIRLDGGGSRIYGVGPYFESRPDPYLFKNPFGGLNDGVETAQLVESIGRLCSPSFYHEVLSLFRPGS
jgi:hypothetical protein